MRSEHPRELAAESDKREQGDPLHLADCLAVLGHKPN